MNSCVLPLGLGVCRNGKQTWEFTSWASADSAIPYSSPPQWSNQKPGQGVGRPRRRGPPTPSVGHEQSNWHFQGCSLQEGKPPCGTTGRVLSKSATTRDPTSNTPPVSVNKRDIPAQEGTQWERSRIASVGSWSLRVQSPTLPMLGRCSGSLINTYIFSPLRQHRAGID